MILKFEPNENEEDALAKLHYHLENYFEGLDDPLNCEPGCRIDDEIEEIPNCNDCVARYIDGLINRMKNRKELKF